MSTSWLIIQVHFVCHQFRPLQKQGDILDSINAGPFDNFACEKFTLYLGKQIQITKAFVFLGVLPHLVACNVVIYRLKRLISTVRLYHQPSISIFYCTPVGCSLAVTTVVGGQKRASIKASRNWKF